MKKSFNYILWCFTFLSVLFSSCKKDDDNYPELQTLSITPLQPGSALFKGNIISTGDKPVADYGFVYGNWSNVDITSGMKVSLGKDAKKGEFTKEVSSIYSSNYDNTIYVRSYITNAEGTAYGKAISATLPRPTASMVNPSSGKVGDKVSISGNFFTTNINDISVAFGSRLAKIIEATNTKLVVEVPSGVPGNQCAITITFKGSQSIQIPNYFNLTPYLKDFSPKSGPIGSQIIITGENLSPYYYYPRLYLGNLEVSFSSNNNSYIVTVPSNVPTGTFKISTLHDGVKTELPGEFTVVPPEITSISPSTALPGQQVTVTGNNFPINYGYYSIRLGDRDISMNYLSGNQFSFTVPPVAEGDYPLNLNYGPGTITSTQKLKVKKHTVTGFSPASGGVGTTLTIQGQFVPNQPYSVTIGNAQTSNYATSSSTLIVGIPYGVEEGKVNIVVQYGDQTATAPTTFEVLGPKITSFSPTSANPGTIVTINGQGFGPNSWGTVKFGTVQTNILSWNDNTIKVAVPSNVTPGSMKLTVVANGQTVISTQNFTLTN